MSKILTTFKFSLFFLYLLTLTRPCRSQGDEALLSVQIFNFYYDQLIPIIDQKMDQRTDVTFRFANSLYFLNNYFSSMYKMQHHFSELMVATQDPNKSSSPQLLQQRKLLYESLSNLVHVNSFVYIMRRYNNIDSFLWNSLFIDLQGPFEKPSSRDALELTIYPASKILMPKFDKNEIQLDLGLPYEPENTRNINDNQFVVMSAPKHPHLFLDDYHILKNLNLEDKYVNKFGELVYKESDTNMLYFFKTLIDERVTDIIAICSDGKIKGTKIIESMEYSELELNEGFDVVNKCSQYWHVDFEIREKNQTYSVKSEMIEKDSTPLFNTYQMTIEQLPLNKSDQGPAQLIKEVKIFVLANWPDHERLPDEMEPYFMGLLDHMYTVLEPPLSQTNSRKAKASKVEYRPSRIAIHCSAGVGRTGTTILAFQIYAQLKKLAKLKDMGEDASFYQLVQKYNHSDETEHFLVDRIPNISKGLVKSNMPQDEVAKIKTVLETSKLLRYLFDCLIYYRIFRTSFVQTPDQFHFLVKFAGDLTISKINQFTWTKIFETNKSDQNKFLV